MNRLALNEAAHQILIQEFIPQTRRSLWIGTADLKDMHVARARGGFEPFLATLARMVERGVEVRLLHAKEPGPRFRAHFDKYAHQFLGSDGFERALCPRVHFKVIISDSRIAYLGSANLTGAGLGARSPHKRNFEAGMVVDDRPTVARLIEQFDRVFMGESCRGCRLYKQCPDPIGEPT